MQGRSKQAKETRGGEADREGQREDHGTISDEGRGTGSNREVGSSIMHYLRISEVAAQVEVVARVSTLGAAEA